MNSYLSSQVDQEVIKYKNDSSYISKVGYSKLVSDLYSPLPEEYDIFRNVDFSFFNGDQTKQQKLISDCLICMRKILLSIYSIYGIICVLPKLNVSKDNDGTITFYFASDTFRAFLSFQDKNGNYNSYYGIVFQTEENSVSTQTRRINEENYERMIEELLLLVIKNS